MCILRIAHTNSLLGGGGLYKRVHPAKEIDLTAVKMIRHIRRSVAVLSPLRLQIEDLSICKCVYS